MRVLWLLLACALVLVGCKTSRQRKVMSLRAASVKAADLTEDLSLAIDPATARVRRGDQVTLVVTAAHDVPEQTVAVRAEVTYPGADGETVTQSVESLLVIEEAVPNLSFRLYAPAPIGYVGGTLLGYSVLAIGTDGTQWVATVRLYGGRGVEVPVPNGLGDPQQVDAAIRAWLLEQDIRDGYMGDPIHATDEGELYLAVELTELPVGETATLTYTMEVGAYSTLRSGETVHAPPALPD